MKYPNSYKVGECWGFPALRQSFTLNNKNQLIFSFPIDHSLYSYSLLDKTFTKILKPTNSSFDIEFKPFPNCDDELIGNEYNYYVKSTARYESIKYDEYNNLYYRIVLFPPKNLDKKNVNNLDMDISIMVLDSDFNLIAEKRLPNNTYDYDDFFVTKDGFWLSKNNTNNPNFNEEIMTFDLFILKNSKQ